MSSETATASATDSPFATDGWKVGVAGGALGGLVFGGMMMLAGMGGVLKVAIPAMYGIAGPALAVGMVLHVAHGAVLGVGFAPVARRFGLGDGSRAAFVGAGAAYGVALWLVLAVFVMPVWLQTAGFAGAPAVPNISVKSLVGHAVYGVVLGGVVSTAGE